MRIIAPGILRCKILFFSWYAPAHILLFFYLNAHFTPAEKWYFI